MFRFDFRRFVSMFPKGAGRFDVLADVWRRLEKFMETFRDVSRRRSDDYRCIRLE